MRNAPSPLLSFSGKDRTHWQGTTIRFCMHWLWQWDISSKDHRTPHSSRWIPSGHMDALQWYLPGFQDPSVFSHSHQCAGNVLRWISCNRSYCLLHSQHIPGNSQMSVQNCPSEFLHMDSWSARSGYNHSVSGIHRNGSCWMHYLPVSPVSVSEVPRSEVPIHSRLFR